MPLTLAQRLSNVESGLISARNKINKLATDEELFSLSDEIEERIYQLANSIEATVNQLNILVEILEEVQGISD